MKPFRLYDLRIALAASLASLNYGINLAAFNPFFIELPIRLNLCDADVTNYTTCDAFFLFNSLATALLFVGVAIGWPLTRWTVDAYGRRFTLAACHVIFIISSLLIVMPFSPSLVYVGRILAGIGLAMAGVAAPLYISEHSPPESRDIRFKFLYKLVLAAGVFISTIFGLINVLVITGNTVDDGFTQQGILTMLLTLPAIISIFGLVLVYFGAETPVYNIANHKLSEATRTLEQIHNKSNVDEEFQEIVKFNDQLASLAPVKIKHCFTKMEYSLPLLAAAFLALIQALSGCSMILSVSTHLFESAFSSHRTATIATFVMSIFNIFTEYLAPEMANVVGVHNTAFSGTAAQLITFWIYLIISAFDISIETQSVVAIISLFGFALCCTFTLTNGPIHSIFISDSVPPRIRNFAEGLCSFIYWVMTGVIALCLTSGLFKTLSASMTVMTCVATLTLLWTSVYLRQIRMKEKNSKNKPTVADARTRAITHEIIV